MSEQRGTSRGYMLRHFSIAAASSMMGLLSGFLLVYGAFQMVAVAAGSGMSGDGGHEFAIAAGAMGAGFGSLSGLGLIIRASRELDQRDN